MEYVVYIILILLAGFLLLASSPLWLGRMLLPGFSFAMARRFGIITGRLFTFIKPDLDMQLLVKASNRYYIKKYENTPYQERVVFLPFCLRPQHCPAAISPEDGLLCMSQCVGCKLGELRAEALAMGYGRVYVVPSSRILKNQNLLPSSQFIKAKISEHSPQAAVGVICAWHLRNRLLPSHKKIGNKGYITSEKQKGAVLYGVLLKGRNCAGAQVDWEALEQAIRLKPA